MIYKQAIFKDYSVNFVHTDNADACHKSCGKQEDCEWWTWDPDLHLCIGFSNCTDLGVLMDLGYPVASSCENCISGQKRFVLHSSGIPLSTLLYM